MKGDLGFWAIWAIVMLFFGLIFLSTIGVLHIFGAVGTLKSDKRITPDIEIQIKNGVSDTTFIYNK